MIVAEVLVKASPRKVIHILDKGENSYFVGMVKDPSMFFEIK